MYYGTKFPLNNKQFILRHTQKFKGEHLGRGIRFVHAQKVNSRDDRKAVPRREGLRYGNIKVDLL